MKRSRLRTVLLISSLLIIAALTSAIVFIVRDGVRREIDRQVRSGTDASLRAFENVQRERELQLSRSASMLADLPTLKALMTTQHAPTIQDASETFWKLGGSDLLVLASPAGRILGLHGKHPELTAALAQQNLVRSIEQGGRSSWWSAAGRLYQVFFYPVTTGTGKDFEQIGFVAVGYEVDRSVAEQLAVVAGSDIALTTGRDVVASTLDAGQERDLHDWIVREGFRQDNAISGVALGKSRYEMASIFIDRAPGAPVQCYVLMSLDGVDHFIRQIDRKIYLLGILAIVFAALSLTFFSRTITRPLDNLVSGVRAMATGDYTYSIRPSGTSEVAELGAAFDAMRGQILDAQRRSIAAERIAAVGRAASSISHDLRHYLATLVANAEFLHEADKLKLNRDEIYGEIQLAAGQMTDLLDSLRELAREGTSISPVRAAIDQTVHRAVESVLTNPDFRSRSITTNTTGGMDGVFDPRKLERVFFNLLLNACEATPAQDGRIAIDIRSHPDLFEIRLSDNGAGIPASIRNSLFDPFISSGKSSGTGLGLAIVNKIVRDHNGTVVVEATSDTGTVFLVRLPRSLQSEVAEPNPAVI